MISDQIIESCAAECDKLGDAEFERLAKKGGIGIARLAQRHYMACAAAIRALKSQSAE